MPLTQYCGGPFHTRFPEEPRFTSGWRSLCGRSAPVHRVPSVNVTPQASLTCKTERQRMSRAPWNFVAAVPV
jgi:hypothetical protein